MTNMYKSSIPENTLKKSIIKIENSLAASSYYNHVCYLKNIILNKIVKTSIVGPSGYILQFTDKTFVVCYLDNNKLTWLVDEDLPTPLHLCLIDLDVELENINPLNLNDCYDQAVSTVKIHENTFNLCFFNKLEINSQIDFKNTVPNLKLSICLS